MDFAARVEAVLLLDRVAIPPDYATVAEVVGQFVAAQDAVVCVVLFAQEALRFFPATLAQEFILFPWQGNVFPVVESHAYVVTAFCGRVAAVGTGHFVSPFVELIQKEEVNQRLRMKDFIMKFYLRGSL